MTTPSNASTTTDAAARGERYDAQALERFATALLVAAGMDRELAATTANVLVEGDLMGHDTHGLALLVPYVKEVEKGSMTKSGQPDVLSDRGASVLWDGRRLPGPWLVVRAVDELMPRARQYGSATLVIRHSHHIACLAAYLLRATDAGFMMLLASSDADVRTVAPHGGTRAVVTPNPIAAGIPTSSTPILIDISSSITTNGMCARLHKAGRQFDEEWLIDAQGRPTRDPAVMYADPPGTVLPLGGLASGYKGFGLALLVEALTGGLAGYGRADPPVGWGATVSVTLHDPSAFGGAADFARQMDWLADATRTNPPRPGFEAVRVPGDRAVALRDEQRRTGVRLYPTIAPMLRECGQRLGVEFPAALG